MAKKQLNYDNFAQILTAVNNNLNSAEAFKVIDELELSLKDWKKIEALFGLKLIEDTPDLVPELYKKIKQRDQARAEKDFAKSDQIRDELGNQGIRINDTPEGGIWEYAD